MITPTWRASGAACLLLVLLGTAACGNNDTKDNNGPLILPGDDMSDLGGADMTTDPPDMASPPDMTDPDMGGDMGVVTPDDRDGDGIPNDEDLCPDVADPEQGDLDRDGVGDACDLLPALHAPSNPSPDERLMYEDESINDDGSSARGNFRVDMVAQGRVDALEDGVGDLDFWTVYVEEPGVYMLYVATNEAAFTPTILFAGTEVATVNTFRVLQAPAGRANVRELFIPTPGWYSLIVSDLNNFLPDRPDQGDSWLYELGLSKLPLPEPRPLDVPTQANAYTDTFETRAWEINASLLSAVKIRSNPAAIGGAEALHQPILGLFDPTEGRTIAFTSAEQINETAQSAELEAVLANGHGKLLIIEDYVQRSSFDKTMVLSVEAPSITAEQETAAAPRDGRSKRPLWIEPGVSLDGGIDAPRMEGGELVADQDIFLLSVDRGQAVSVTVRPSPGGQLQPYVEVGHAWAQGDTEGFSSIHSVQAREEDAGQPRTVRFVAYREEEGDLAVRIRHRANVFGGDPVGGGPFGYTIEVERWDPSPAALDPSDPAQASAQIVMANGDVGLAQFTDTVGDPLWITNTTGALFGPLRIVDTSTWTIVNQTYSETLLHYTPMVPTTYWMDFRDFSGDGTEDPITLGVSAITTTPLPQDTPTQGELATRSESDFWAITIPASIPNTQAVEVRATAPYSPYIALHLGASQGFTQWRSGSGRVLFRPTERDLTARLFTYADPSASSPEYMVGWRTITPATLTAPPVSVTGTLDRAPFGAWYKVAVTAGQTYQARAETTGSPQLRVEVIDPSDLLTIESGVETARWVADADGEVWISASPNASAAFTTIDYTLSVSAVVATPLPPNTPTTAQLASASEEALYEVVLPSAGLIDVEITPTGDWPISAQVVRSDTLNTFGVRRFQTTYRYPNSAYDRYKIIVRCDDPSATGAPFAYTITARTLDRAAATAEVEPNDAEAEALAIPVTPGPNGTVVTGTLGAPDMMDQWTVQLEPGQRLWAMVSGVDATTLYDLDMTLELVDPLGNLVTTNSYSGEGFYPGLYAVQVPYAGQWRLRARLPDGSADTGTYFMYVFVGTIPNVNEIEPNDDLATAQDLGTINDAVLVHTTLDATDTLDLFRFTVTTSVKPFITAPIAADGHTLRLLDDQGNELYASGVGFDGEQKPVISPTSIPAGTYHVELGKGAAPDGAASVLVRTVP